MEFKRELMRAGVFIILFVIVLIKNAYAYLDPGTGSYFFQLLIAGLLGFLFLFKKFWHHILQIPKTLFLRLLRLIKR